MNNQYVCFFGLNVLPIGHYYLLFMYDGDGGGVDILAYMYVLSRSAHTLICTYMKPKCVY